MLWSSEYSTLCPEKKGETLAPVVVISMTFNAFTAQKMTITIYFQKTKSLIETKQATSLLIMTLNSVRQHNCFYHTR